MEQSQNKNFLIALFLAMAILFCWQYFYSKPKEQERRQQLAQYEQEKAAFEKKRQLLEASKAAAPAPIVEPARRIPIETPSLKGSINLRGARLDKLVLLGYKRSRPTDSKHVELLSPADKKSIYFAEFGWIAKDKNITLPTPSTVWSSSDTQLAPNHPITLSWKNSAGITFEIILAVDDLYMFSITRNVYNRSKQPITLATYGLINRTHDTVLSSTDQLMHNGPLSVHNNVLYEYSFDKIKKEQKASFTESNGWIGFTDKYWFTSIIPATGSLFNANLSYYVRDLKERYQVDYTGQSTELSAGGTLTDTTHFFAGAKQVSVLDDYAKQYAIPLFDRAVDFGWLYFITKPIFLALTFFHTLVGNFGVAILLLTVCIKTILFPLSYKSYVSMHKLKQYQPQITALKERYGDNKLQMNKEIMSLYKREKINPASGCLPILVQIPIFFALYRVLSVTIEMRHAPFFGWITDLSAQDPTSIFNLFGLLPYSVSPAFQLGVWPLVMGITMYWQQRVNPQPADPIQAKLFKMFPFVFTFLLYRFPAGLVIYWAWNNILTIFQQWVITLRLPKPTPTPQTQTTSE
jgi:YidC/Oxa1 family membrane protein insertase